MAFILAHDPNNYIAMISKIYFIQIQKESKDVDPNYNAAQLVRESHCTGCGDTEPSWVDVIAVLGRSAAPAAASSLIICICVWSDGPS